jgi:hypothetical protein
VVKANPGLTILQPLTRRPCRAFSFIIATKIKKKKKKKEKEKKTKTRDIVILSNIVMIEKKYVNCGSPSNTDGFLKSDY